MGRPRPALRCLLRQGVPIAGIRVMYSQGILEVGRGSSLVTPQKSSSGKATESPHPHRARPGGTPMCRLALCTRLCHQ